MDTHSWHEKGWIGTLAINKAIQNILIIEFTHVTVTFHWITIPSICPKKNCKLKIFTATNRSSNFQFKLHINLAGRWVLMLVQLLHSMFCWESFALESYKLQISKESKYNVNMQAPIFIVYSYSIISLSQFIHYALHFNKHALRTY